MLWQNDDRSWSSFFHHFADRFHDDQTDARAASTASAPADRSRRRTRMRPPEGEKESVTRQETGAKLSFFLPVLAASSLGPRILIAFEGSLAHSSIRGLKLECSMKHIGLIPIDSSSRRWSLVVRAEVKPTEKRDIEKRRRQRGQILCAPICSPQ